MAAGNGPGGAGLEGWFQDPGSTHHDIHHGHPVAYRFEFQPGSGGSITARGSCHPAWEYQQSMLADASRIVSRAEITILLQDPQKRRETLERLGATPGEVQKAMQTHEKQPERVQIHGALLTMDATQEPDGDTGMQIRIVEETQWAVTHHKIDVPTGMGDCVVPLWGTEVVATAQREPERLVLLDIMQD